MEVTRENFSQAFNILENKLPAADFISIDAEFTGLSTLKGPRFSYDTLEQNYQKAKEGCDKFLIVQYGICLFTWNEDEKKYSALPFTFYVYPRPYKRHFNDVMFMVQSSCLDFLAQNDFDFNKLFYGGVSFIHPSTEEKVTDKFDQAARFVSNKENRLSSQKNESAIIPKKETNIFVPKDKREFIKQILSSVEQFVIDTSENTLDLSPCEPFKRKLIYEILEEKYPMGMYLQSEINAQKEKFIRVVKVKSKSGKLKEELQKETDSFNQISAFNCVMKLLVNSQKPIVGHNMFLDLFYTVTNFFTPAPDTLDEYKSLVSGLFPSIFDTKVLSSTQPLSGMVSGTGLKRLTESIGINLAHADTLFDDSLDETQQSLTSYHDAGYDALSTGRCFISLMNSLMLHFDQSQGPIDLTGNLIRPFNNRIFIMGIQDINYMNIHKEDEIPSRQGVYLVKFPSDWKETELHNVFSSISKLVHPIVWVNSTSAYVGIKDKSKHNEVMNKHVLNNKFSNNFQVIPFPEEVTASPVQEASNFKRKLEESDLEDGELSNEEECVEDQKKPKLSFEVSNDW